MDRNLAREYIEGKRKLSYALLPEVEQIFLSDNHIRPPQCQVYFCDCQKRRFLFTPDKAKYYCSPTIDYQRFSLHNTGEVVAVDLLSHQAGDSSLTGGVLFGVTGAIVGSSQKKVTITVKLTTSNINEPFVELPIISIPTSPKKPVYNHCLDIANKIYGQFRKIINNKPETGGPQRADAVSRYRRPIDQIKRVA